MQQKVTSGVQDRRWQRALSPTFASTNTSHPIHLRTHNPERCTSLFCFYLRLAQSLSTYTMTPANEKPALKLDNITVPTIASAQITESTVTTTSAQSPQAIDRRKWHFDLTSAPHRYAWNAPTSKQAHLPLRDGSSSGQDLKAREAEKPSHFRHRTGTAEHKLTSTIPEQHPTTDYSAYPPRNDSLGKKAATRKLRAITLPSREADLSYPDSGPTNVERTRRLHKDIGSVSGKDDGYKSVRTPLPRGTLSVESDPSESSSARVLDKITHPNMLQPFYMPVKDSTASTTHSGTDNDNSEVKESGPQGRREPFTLGTVVDELFRSSGKIPGRLAGQESSSTDSGDTQIKDSRNRHALTRFLKSKGKIKDHPWFKKRARRLELLSIPTKYPINLQDSLSKAGSSWKHTGNPEVQMSRRKKLRRTQSFSDLRHNVKSDGRNSDNEIPSTRLSQTRKNKLKMTHPARHVHHPTSSNIDSLVQTQWDILRTTAPMDIKGTSSTESTPSLCKRQTETP